MNTPVPNAPGITQEPATPAVEYVPGKTHHVILHRIFWILLVGIPALPGFIGGMMIHSVFAWLAKTAGWGASLFLRYGGAVELRLGRRFPCRVPKAP